MAAPIPHMNFEDTRCNNLKVVCNLGKNYQCEYCQIKSNSISCLEIVISCYLAWKILSMAEMMMMTPSSPDEGIAYIQEMCSLNSDFHQLVYVSKT